GLDPQRTFNPPGVVAWNMSTAHVLDLAGEGVRTPRSIAAATLARAGPTRPSTACSSRGSPGSADRFADALLERL
ncbi:MAG TPA: hypothetical protein VFL90_16810, partial [Methylomirabilota bacterium]|nr:hypothetical protein [Methylomirabilota bacterium]